MKGWDWKYIKIGEDIDETLPNLEISNRKDARLKFKKLDDETIRSIIEDLDKKREKQYKFCQRNITDRSRLFII